MTAHGLGRVARSRSCTHRGVTGSFPSGAQDQAMAGSLEKWWDMILQYETLYNMILQYFTMFGLFGPSLSVSKTWHSSCYSCSFTAKSCFVFVEVKEHRICYVVPPTSLIRWARQPQRRTKVWSGICSSFYCLLSPGINQTCLDTQLMSYFG